MPIGAAVGGLSAAGSTAAVDGVNAMQNMEQVKKAVQGLQQSKLKSSVDLLNSNKDICNSIRL